MAVYVKPNGLLGDAYMAAIRPFRYLVVYPAMLRELGRIWQAGADDSRRLVPDSTQGPEPTYPPTTP
jgi:hypothetical protein